MRRFLCLFFPRWPLQRLRLASSETRGKATALFERTAHGPRLTVCSGEALRAGARSEMSGADARALIPELLLYEADFDADRADLEALALWTTRFSPLVSVEGEGEHVRHPQSLFLETTGCEKVFGGEPALLSQTLSSLKKRGYTVRAAIASTPGAAWAVAHYGRAGSLIDNEPAALRAALEGLPLAALRLNLEILEDLRPLGLNRVGDVLRQHRATLPSRFGPVLLERLDQALGVVPELLTLLRPAPEFRVAAAFDYPIRNWEMLFGVLERKVAALSKTLQHAGRGARQIECWIYHEIAAPVYAEAALHRSSAGRKHLWQLLRTRLEDVFRTPHARLKTPGVERAGKMTLEAEEGICAVALQVPSTDPLEAGQLALFEDNPEEHNGSLALLLDRLVTRLGPAAVRRVRLVDDPVPERAYCVQTLAQHAATSGAPAVEIQATERPLSLLPEAVSIQCDLPRTVTFRGKTHTLRSAQGPERIESGWWRQNDARRDYYIVETEAGLRFWIFQCLSTPHWFLHGIFD